MSKVAGIVLILGSLCYVISEAISATYFNASLINTYLFHTISELGIPNANSPFFWLMNFGFILIGLVLLFSCFYEFKEYFSSNKCLCLILSMITAVGVVIVGCIHGGNPLTSGYHTLGAVMAILGGNVFLVVISKSMVEFKSYQKITLILGVIGLTAFWVMFFNVKSMYMPVFERISVYTLIIWCFFSGVYLIRN